MASVIRGSDLFDTKTAIGFSTNIDSATGTVTIPSGLEIGTRRLIRKIHPTQGTVTINCTGETFTRAGLSSVELNADGDYWLLEKVTTTRWELVDGWNTGENANGRWVRAANGVQRCINLTAGSTTCNISIGNIFRSVPVQWNFPIAFHTLGTYQFNVSSGASTISAGVARWDNIQSYSNTFARYSLFSALSSAGTTVGVTGQATGRWYA